MKGLKLINGLLIAFLAISPMLVNAEIPSWYKQTGYDISGIVEQIDTRNKIIWLGDDQINLSSRVKVHSIDDEFFALSRIKAGDFVGVDVSELPDGMVEIVEIWLLDKDNPVQAFPGPVDSSQASGRSPSDPGKGENGGLGVKKQWRK